MNKKLKYLLTSILATVMIFCLVACGGGKKAKFKLDQTSLTINVGESAGLIVTKDNEEYYGPISWVSGDDMVATVSQRVVTGVRAGQIVVRAVINYEGETYELSCDVTVKAVVSADLNMISGYLGAGDITITATAAELPTGATAKAVKLTSPSGKDCTNLLKTVGQNEVVSNSFDNPLEEGAYTITYDLKTIDASSQTTRELRVIKADGVDDLLILDAIDGTEHINGKVIEYNWEPGYGNWVDKEIGEYVTYTENGNTGYTEENGINQNLAEFEKSLEDAGYNGSVDNGTVYRMYAKKTTTVGKALYFMFNLPYTSNSIWTNLNAVPNGATIDVWVRFWFRPTGYDNYVLAEGGGAYAYKVLAEGISAISSAGYSAKFATDSWGKISWQIDNNRELLNGAKNLAFTIPFNQTYVTNPETGVREYVNLTGDVYCELYSVELGISDGDVMTNFTGVVESDFFGSHTGLFDSVEVSISKDGEPIEYEDGDKLDVGVYDITYTIKNGTSTFDVVNKKLQVCSIDTRIQNYSIPDTTNYYNAMHSGNMTSIVTLDGLTSHGGADISQKPEKAKGIYTACLSVTPGVNQWETGVAFDISDILKNIDEYEDKFLTLWVASYFYGERGAFLTKASTSQGRVVGISQTEWATGGMPMNVASGSTNGWTEIKIPISTLKSNYENNKGATHILYGFRTNATTPLYIYALEVTEKENTVVGYLPDGENYYAAAKNGNTISTVSMKGLTSHGGADISQKPAGAKAEYDHVLAVTPGADQWETAIGFDISDILANIDDYKGYNLTLYVASYFYGSRGVYLTTFNEAQNRVVGITQTEYGTGGMAMNVAEGSTNGWIAVSIPISTLKAAAESKQDANYILFAFRSNANTPVYVYSLEVQNRQAVVGYLPDGENYYAAAKNGNTISTVSMNGLTSHGGADISQKPAGAKAEYDHVLAVTPGANQWETAIGFDISDILANIDSYEGYTLTLYVASYFYGSRGVYLTTFNEAQNRVVGIDQTEYGTGGMAMNVAEGSTNGWIAISIPISTLKAAAESKAGANYILFAFRSDANTPVYVYSLELTEPKPAEYGSLNDIDTIGGNNGVLHHFFWTDANNVSLVEASTLTDTIGIPSGTSYSADKKVLKVTPKMNDYNEGQIGVDIKVPTLAENINAYNDNDYISLWVYVPTPTIYNGVINEQFIRIANGHISGAGVKSANIATNVTLDGWCQLTVTIGELKSVAEANDISTISDIYFTIRFFSADQAVYVYGLEIIKGV